MLVATAILLLPGAAPAGPLQSLLDQVLESAGSGIVQIETRRAWETESADGSPGTVSERMPVKRILGNGILWDLEGHILTVADLAQPGDSLRVVWNGGGVSRAEFITQDPDLGLSLIQTRFDSPTQPIQRGEPSSFQTRDWVLTVFCRGGSPARHLAVAQLGTHGMREQSLRIRLEGVDDPGLAGAGVLDEEGRLIGILLGEGTESLLLRSGKRRSPVEYCCIRPGGPSESGWVLPIDQMEQAVGTFLRSPNPSQGFLGVRIPVPPENTGTREGPGLAIADVMPGSPAERAGIRPGDRLISFNGRKLGSWDEVTRWVGALGPGKLIRVRLLRDGKPVTMRVRLEDRAHTIWRQRQREMADSREKTLRRQIEGLNQQLELLRHQLAQTR